MEGITGKFGICTTKNGKVIGVPCMFEEFETLVWYLIHLYKKPERVKELLSHGEITKMGAITDFRKFHFEKYLDYIYYRMAVEEYPSKSLVSYSERNYLNVIEPKVYDSFEQFEADIGAMCVFIYSPDRTKTHWVIRYYDYTTGRKEPHAQSLDYFLQPEKLRYFYHWIFYSYNYERISDVWDKCVEHEKYMYNKSKELTRKYRLSDKTICNEWLAWVKTDLEITSTKADGEEVYSLMRPLQVGDNKRKCIMKTNNLNEITLWVCNQFNIDIHLRPLF